MDFITEKKGNIFLIKLPPLNSEKTLKPLSIQMKKWLLEDCDIFLFNFIEVHLIEQSILREFGVFQRTLKKNMKLMFSINLNSSLELEFKTKGLLDVFQPVKDITQIIQKANYLKQKG